MLTDLTLMFVLYNIVYAIVFIAAVSLIKEPIRQKAMAIMVAMAGGLFAVPPHAEWGFMVGAVIAVCGYFGLRFYSFIGIGWLLHAAWDTVRYHNDAGIVGQPPIASLGCAIFDPMIALWFFLGAPSIWKFARKSASDSTMTS